MLELEVLACGESTTEPMHAQYRIKPNPTRSELNLRSQLKLKNDKSQGT